VQFLQTSGFVLVNICLFGSELGGPSKGHLEQDENHKGRVGSAVLDVHAGVHLAKAFLYSPRVAQDESRLSARNLLLP